MTQQTETILDRIVAHKREELTAAQITLPFAELKSRLAEAPPVRPFGEAIRGSSIRLIAEVKKTSPSKGLLRADLDPASLAQAYAGANAAAISILTDEKHFSGTLRHLQAVRATLPAGPPLLRKDFLFDAYQLYEARLYGADAVLLIAAILDPDLLAQLIALAHTLGMSALVEVHDERELERALNAKARIIGINNRNLRTFEVTLATSERLRSLIPTDKTVVAESGVHTRAEVKRLATAGVQAVLIGEALVTATNPAAKIRELFR